VLDDDGELVAAPVPAGVPLVLVWLFPAVMPPVAVSEDALVELIELGLLVAEVSRLGAGLPPKFAVEPEVDVVEGLECEVEMVDVMVVTPGGRCGSPAGTVVKKTVTDMIVWLLVLLATGSLRAN
jgi:hypothetical protein